MVDQKRHVQNEMTRDHLQVFHNLQVQQFYCYDVIPETANTLPPQVRRVAVVDGMFVVKKLQKSSKVNTEKDVSTLFNSQLISMTCSYDEIILHMTPTSQIH